MNISDIVTIISQIGFPIAVCLICFWYINKVESEHKAEVDNLSNAVSNNTLVMQKILDKLDVTND